MCSGGAIPRCIVDLTGYYLALVLEEACSDCPVCTGELQTIQKLLRQVGRGEGGAGALEELKRLAARAREEAACGIGRIGAKIVAEALANYDEEFAAHVQEKYCPAGVCDIRYVVEAGG